MRPVHRRRLTLLGISVIVLVSFAEAGSAIYYYGVLDDSRREALEVMLAERGGGGSTVMRYRAHPYLNYVGNPAYQNEAGVAPHTEWGLRKPDWMGRPKREGVRRVVSIGGSTTYGMNFGQYQNTWPYMIGEWLKSKHGIEIEAVNAGVPNYTTYELMVLATMLLPELSPDIVVIHTGLNDAYTVGYPDEGGPDNTRFRYPWAHEDLGSATRVLLGFSHFARALVAGGLQLGDMTSVMQFPIPRGDALDANVAAATGRYYRRNLGTLVDLVRAMGAEPVLVNMPINPATDVEALGPFYVALAQAVHRNNRIMTEVAATREVALVDIVEAVREPAYFTDAAHMTVPGMRARAAAVGEGLAQLEVFSAGREKN